ncbi:hypothetical protein GCM10010246_04350 [Streptomyces cuspidosporus]|uniref:Uncharacterized protein n=1 Tax=Streptomyces cuspidosporus TaxID=66882 RepID=A0ABN3FBH9_9ACTN
MDSSHDAGPAGRPAPRLMSPPAYARSQHAVCLSAAVSQIRSAVSLERRRGDVRVDRAGGDQFAHRAAAVRGQPVPCGGH